MHRIRKNAPESSTTSPRSCDEYSKSNHHKKLFKKGIRKRIEVVISRLRHEGFLTRLRKGAHALLAVSIIASAIITVFSMPSLPHRHSRKIPHNMVQLIGEGDYSRVKFLSHMKLNFGPLINYRPERHIYKHGHENFEEGNCKAMHQWQLEAFPTCNVLHERDMNKIDHVAKGGFRDVWEMKDWDGTKIAVKTLVEKRKFTYREYDRHRRDALATSLLTSSKHIANIYGYCTNSGMFDYSPKGSMENHIHNPKKQQWTQQQKLRFSWQAAAALADLHGVAMMEGSASISHTDIAVDQFLWIDGMYKLNDFNRARFIRWDIVKNEPCTFFISKNPGRSRSPEEYNYKDLTEKIDVYSLGNILYRILTNYTPFHNLKQDRVEKLVKQGIRPPIPDKLWGTEELAIIKAIKMCWVQNPKDRSSAKDVDSFLKGKLLKLNVTMF